jgi:peptidylprolyl isomerase
MFRKITLSLFSALFLISLPAFSEETKAKENAKLSSKESDVLTISEAFGHLIAKNIEGMGVTLDVPKMIKGLEDSMAGKSSPMSESECIQAISHIQENVFKQTAKENIEKANAFLSANKEQDGIVELEAGKLQYKVEKQGQGALVETHFSPLIKYTGKFINGTVFGSSKEDEVISLDETIPGFSKGLLGMQEGEKRVLFIHPDLAYGTGGYLPPNSLLIFEIEVVKANAPTSQESASISSNPTDGKEKSSGEIATKDEEAVR